MPIILNRYHVPGHSWLKVPLSLLEELGIAGLISSYSYKRGGSAYLEDESVRDFLIFHTAMKRAGRTYRVRNHRAERSRIPTYPIYDPVPHLKKSGEYPELLAAHLGLHDAWVRWYDTLHNGVATIADAHTPEGLAHSQKIKELVVAYIGAHERFMSKGVER